MMVNLMGLALKNPILVAAGPWARNARSIQKCIDQGAAAVITESITLEANANACPRFYRCGDQLFNTKLYSDLHLEQWEAEMEAIKKGDAKLICSIWGSSASEIAYLASKVERLGADAIEISVSAPIGTRNQAICNHMPNVYEFMHAAVEAVSIPVMAKLSYEAAISPDFLHAVQEAGVRAVSAIDALKGFSGVDIESACSRMPTYGGYTGAQIRPVAMAATTSIKQYTPMQICSVGGITNFENVVEYLMMGAEAVQLASVIQIEGYEVIGRILRDLTNWMDAHRYTTVSEFSGAALPTIRPFEDLPIRQLAATLTEPCRDETCEFCRRGCLYDAVRYSETGVELIRENCSGCGLCATRCPHGRIRLEWK